MAILKEVRSKGGNSPRGECYEWCQLMDDGTLTFGSESGNYCGGVVLSSNYYYDIVKDFAGREKLITFKDEGESPIYWKVVKERLDDYKNTMPNYYNDIMDMIKDTPIIDKIKGA